MNLKDMFLTIISQNTKQFNKNPKAFSYTLYDALGRITEVGEKAENTVGIGNLQFAGIFGTFINGKYNPGVIDDAKLNTWVNGNGARTEVTKTFYDNPVTGITLPPGFTQDNLRKRVSTVTYEDVNDNNDLTYQHGILFGYDIHGNVKALIQDNPSLASITPSQQYKRTDYEYDLVSGNVNAVHYQAGYPDQFHHRYVYDADNRITSVYTSKDNQLWDQDAKYFYYPHGPLARTEIGDLQVQGTDFAYTIQGWVKGINSNILNPHNDIGQDAKAGTINKNFARDAFGYSLNYFPGDYKDIGSINPIDHFVASITASAYLSTDAPGLFNGNISSMVTTISDLSNTPLPQLTAYRYDQLNRIKQMKAYRDINLSINAWGTGSTYDGSYEESYKYDANGNILKLKRNGLAGISGGQMDDLKYYFYDNTGGIYDPEASVPSGATNKRAYATDAVASGTYTDDMDTQSSGNYAYDEIGNLRKDDFECIQNIEWTVYGKVKKVTRTPGCLTEGTAMPDLEFKYDPSGNLVAKIVKPAGQINDPAAWITTHYVNDATGNILATYEQSTNSQTQTASFKLTEKQIYGSSHIGTDKNEIELIGAPPINTTSFTRTLGRKQFFLSDHRGNNNVTVSDKKIPIESTTTPGTVDHYLASIDRAVDYFPFGREQNGRIFNKDESEFGYNGKQNIKEWSARLGSPQNFGARIYDPNCGCWKSVDPKFKLYVPIAPYAFSINSPMMFIDRDGRVIKDANGNIVTVSGDAKGNAVFTVTDKNGKIVTNGTDPFTKEVLSAVFVTETGKNIIDKMQTSPDVFIYIESTKSKGLFGETEPVTRRKTTTYKMTLYTKEGTEGTEGTLFEGASREEFLNSIGVHEPEHFFNSEQVKLDALEEAADLDPTSEYYKTKGEERVKFQAINFETAVLKTELKTRQEFKQAKGLTLDPKIQKKYKEIIDAPKSKDVTSPSFQSK